MRLPAPVSAPLASLRRGHMRETSGHPAPPHTGVLAASVAPGSSSQTPGAAAGSADPTQEGGAAAGSADPTCRMQQPECAETVTSLPCEQTLWNPQIRTRQAVRSRLATRPRPHRRDRLATTAPYRLPCEQTLWLPQIRPHQAVHGRLPRTHHRLRRHSHLLPTRITPDCWLSTSRARSTATSQSMVLGSLT